jgi:hypothetical protein
VKKRDCQCRKQHQGQQVRHIILAQFQKVDPNAHDQYTTDRRNLNDDFIDIAFSSSKAIPEAARVPI